MSDLNSPATSPGPRTPSTPSPSTFSATTPPKKPSRQRPRLRNLNLTKLFPLSRAHSSPAEGATPFTPVHAPDRPRQLTPASAAPSEQECRDFFMAFRSPKKLGFLDDENEGEDRRFSGIDMSLWRPWLLSKDIPPPAETGDAEREARRQTMSPLTALSESPLLQEAVAMRHADSVAARLVDVDARAKTPPSEVVQPESPPQSPEEYRPRQNSFFTTLQEARTRSSLLASHRMAARGSIEARDSGYKSWRGSEQRKSGAGDGLSLSPKSTSSGFSRHSSIRPGGLGHVAHQFARSSDASLPRPPSSEPLSVKSSFAGTRLSAVAGRESIATSLQCQCGDAEDKGRDGEVYGDWAEYYFEADNFAPSTGDTASMATVRGAEGSRASSVSVSPKTSWYEPDDIEEVRKTVCPVQRGIMKGRREAFTYRTRREVMEVPGYRFEHESYGEAVARQECALGSVWTRSGGRWEEASGLL